MALKEEGQVKIRQNGLTLDNPQRWHFPTLKTDIVFDVDGTAIVPGHIAEKLLGPKYTGYSLVGKVEKEPEPVKEEIKPAVKQEIKPRAKTVETPRKITLSEQKSDETTEFVKEIS